MTKRYILHVFLGHHTVPGFNIYDRYHVRSVFGMNPRSYVYDMTKPINNCAGVCFGFNVILRAGGIAFGPRFHAIYIYDHMFWRAGVMCWKWRTLEW